MIKVLEEYFVPAPWGNIALVTWGNPKGDPVLLVHGTFDSLATFIPLLEQMPDKYHYVTMDLPGHGKSDMFPTSVMLLRFHLVTAVEVVVRHMQWKQFVYIGHSMGAEVGLLYNAIQPGVVKKIVHIEPGLPLQVIQYPNYQHYMAIHESYYEIYNKIDELNKIHTKRRALDTIMKARGLTEEQAEIITSRILVKVGEDQYKFSADKRFSFPASLNLPPNYWLEIFSKNAPPTLVFVAKTIKTFRGLDDKMKESSDKLLTNMEKRINNFYVKTVDGNHDVHLINPERIVSDIINFLEIDFGETRSKL